VRHLFRNLQAEANAPPVDEREELYGSMVPIYVDAEVGGTLYDAIDLALGREKIEYQGVGEVEKSTTVTYLPPILQFQIVRAQFNRSVGAGYKENAHIELESKIYMDRYVDMEDDDLNTRRDDYWKWKVELEKAQGKRAELLKKVHSPLVSRDGSDD
jgi:ubiquitin carboxyl-terminal hydrolase 25